MMRDDESVRPCRECGETWLELCPRCMTEVPETEIEALIGTPRLCFDCRQKEQQRRLDESFALTEPSLLGLS